MDYRKDTAGTMSGGADGCMNFDDGDNKGLRECVTSFGLAEAYKPVCDSVSLADFLVIAGEAVMGRAATGVTSWAPGDDAYYAKETLAGHFMRAFKWGRATNNHCDMDTHLMPDPENGCQGLEDIFVDHIYADTGMPWTMTAAISGTHTLGSAKVKNSGYDGWWSDIENQGLFNNDYYRSMLVKGWTQELRVIDGKTKDQWVRSDMKGPLERPDLNAKHKEIMLTTDLCMVYRNNPKFDDCMHSMEKGTKGRRRKCKE